MTTCELPERLRKRNSDTSISCSGFLNESGKFNYQSIPTEIYTLTSSHINRFSRTSVLPQLLSYGGDWIQCKKSSMESAKGLVDAWRARLLDKNAPINAKELSKTVKPLFQVLLWFGPGAVDLRGLPVGTINGMHLAVVLRATLSRKNQIFGWDQALQVAKDALLRDGLDPTDALSGLL